MHGLVVIEGMTLSGHPWIINEMCDQELLDDPPILLFDTMYARPEKSTRLLSQNRLGLKRNQGRLEAMKKKLAEDCIKA